jgi:hypothetical protein
VAIFRGILALNYGWSAFASARKAQPINAAEQVWLAMAPLAESESPNTVAAASEIAGYASDRHYQLFSRKLLSVTGAASRGDLHLSATNKLV